MMLKYMPLDPSGVKDPVYILIHNAICVCDSFSPSIATVPVPGGVYVMEVDSDSVTTKAASGIPSTPNAKLQGTYVTNCYSIICLYHFPCFEPIALL